MWKARNHITNIPYPKNISCQTHKDGNPKGAHNAGELGSEKKSFPMVAKGPKPTRNHTSVNPQANLIFFFLFGVIPVIDWRSLCFLVFTTFAVSDSPEKCETKNVVNRLKKIPQPALWIVKGYAPQGTPNQADVLSVKVTAIRPTTNPKTTPLVVNPL